MQSYPELEISIHQRNDGVLTLDGRFSAPQDADEKRLGAKQPIELPLDLLTLHDSLPDMLEYGRVLSQAFFTPEVRDFFSKALAAAGSEPLRFRLLFGPTASTLHGIHWESLLNPLDGTQLSANQNILFSRYLASETWKAVRLKERGKVRALVAVAGPSDLPNYKLAPVDVPAEMERARRGLAKIETTCLPSEAGRCTLPALMDALRQGYDILYLAAHGTLVNGMPYLWLEDDNGKVRRVSGREFADLVSGLSAPPGLVVLASCESAGKAETNLIEGQPLNAFGPLLAEAGVPAVVAMQGKISMSSVAAMMPVFFEELLKDGLVDRALAAARGALQAKRAPDAWVPVLFSRLRTGQIWQEAPGQEMLQKVEDTTRQGFRWQWVWFSLIFLAVIGVGAGLYFGLRPAQKPVMTGEFRIAIASFAEQGSGLPDKAGYTIGDGIYIRLSDDLREISVGPKVELWGPDRIGVIAGKTPAERAENAAKLAREIHAYMVIYGLVETAGGAMRVTPEFYLDTQGFSEGSEIIGQYELGSPFTIPGANNPAWVYDFNRQMYTRSDVISSFATGLSYFAIQDYQSALEIFQKINAIEAWDDISGRKVLYALLGFAAGKVGDYELTETMLKQALEIDPEYARPYIGLANVAYMRSLLPFQESKNPAEIDFSLLQECDALLEKARQAKNKPPLAEVETKIHFAQGQCSMMTVYSGHGDSFAPAMQEFEQVIAAYEAGKNPRLQELAGEAYARLALIYSLSGHPDQAGEHYQKAAATLRLVSPQRAKLYQERAQAILGITPTP